MHTVIDDHSRVADAEICIDETATTAIGVLERAVASPVVRAGELTLPHAVAEPTAEDEPTETWV